VLSLSKLLVLDSHHLRGPLDAKILERGKQGLFLALMVWFRGEQVGGDLPGT
jgi:hypothetical protein